MLAVTAIALCASCHAQIVRDYLQTPMGRSTGRIQPGDEKSGSFLHPASKTRFDLTRASGGLELSARGQRTKLELYIGSRHNGRSYVWQTGDFLYQAPVGYYTARAVWDMAPGYANDREPDLNRPITRECLFCHATGAQFAAATLNRVLNWQELRGIGCERCHGEGAPHARSPHRDNIINPARLAPVARDSVCEQCHLAGKARIPLAGRRIEDFEPGQEFSDYVDVLLAKSAQGGISVTGHAEALARSRCKQMAGDRLWCGTCHSPHSATVSFRDRCVGCHQSAHSDGDCIGCHMPKARAYDGGHTIFTDHSIRKKPSNAESEPVQDLVRFYSKVRSPLAVQRSFGLAYADLANATGRREWTEKAWPLLRAASQGRAPDALLLTQLAWMLQQHGLSDKAIDIYRASLEQDRYQLPALVNLGALLAERGQHAAARGLFERALAMNPRQAAVKAALDKLAAP